MERVFRHIDGNVESWQRPGPRHRLVFTLLGMLIALSFALLLDGEEAQAKGGKQTSKGDSAKGAIGGSTKPAREAVGEANKLASNEGGGHKDVESLTARDPAPRADRPAPIGNGTVRDAPGSINNNQVTDKAPSVVDPLPETNPPIVERTGSLGEVAGKAKEATGLAVEPVPDEVAVSAAVPGLEEETKLPRAEPILEETAKPEVAPILESATSTSRPVFEETTSMVEPLLDTASSKIDPVLKRATAPVSPALKTTASTVEPLLGEVNLPVKPALAETLPAVEPVLDGAVSAADAPVDEAVGPAARPSGEEAIPVSGPRPEDAAFPGVEPAFGAAAPVFKSAFETVAPAIGPGFGEGVVRQSTESPVLEGNPGGAPAPLSTLQPHALAADARIPLGSARDYGPVHAEPPVSAIEPPAGRSGFFDGSFVIDESQAARLDTIMAEDAPEGPPRPFPFTLPPAAPPVGVSFGSSGAGVALALLAILALLPILSRDGGLSWSNRAAFKLGSSLRLAVERPG